MAGEEKTVQPFAPVYDEHTRLLILGSFPSVKSREQGFYYGHPQNRFWRLISELCKEALPVTVEEKKALLLRHGIALWDVIESCEITGSADSSIKNVTAADIAGLLKKLPDCPVFVNGGKAFELYEKYAKPLTGLPAVKLPSTSPANAACGFEKLKESWGNALKEKEIDLQEIVDTERKRV